ncbi:MAG: TraR/DksA C4-type zinc finger protein [Patescibacteria group bacterium]|nr:TraR/DksA C4-type zinc finger protein [Patescibacteria group bacterium]
MDKEFMKKMEEELLKQQTKLRGELSSFADESVKKEDDYNTRFPNYGDKDEENATEVADFQDNLSLEKNLEKTLGKVDVALEKIKNGTYGKCDKCANEIDAARLEAFPAAVLCMECNKFV